MKLNSLLPPEEKPAETQTQSERAEAAELELMASTEIQVIPAGEGPDTDAMKPAESVIVTLRPFEVQLGQLFAKADAALAMPDGPESAELADTLHKEIRENRLAMQHIYEDGTEAMRRIKREIDELWRKWREGSQAKEAALKEKKDFVAREEARLAELRRVERTALLEPLGVDYTYLSLAQMPEEAFAALYSGAVAQKAAREAEALRLAEEARKAEEARIAREKAEAEAREAQRLENERLRKEAEEREARAEAERAAAEQEARRLREEAAAREAKIKAEAEAERKRIEAENERQRAVEAEKARKEREAIEAKARKEREAAEAKAREEAAARKKLEDEIAARKAAEQARKDKEAAEAAALAAAGDKELVLHWMDAVRNCKPPSLKNRAVESALSDLHRKMLDHIEKQSANLNPENLL
jgi:hypothetical protein